MKKLTYNQLNLLDTFNSSRKPISGEHLECFDWRSLRGLFGGGYIEVKKICGCPHICGCRSYIKVTAAGKQAIAGFNFRTHKKAPGGYHWLGAK